MALPILVGIGAFIILGTMFALLWLSSRRDEREDAVTQEIVLKASTAPVRVVADTVIVMQDEEED